MKSKYFNMIQYITKLIHIRSTGITTFETRTGTPIFTNKDGYNHFTTNKDGYANFIDNKDGYTDFRNKDGYTENKGEEMENKKKEIKKEIEQEYVRALIRAKIEFAKKHDINLELKDNFLRVSRLENGIIGDLVPWLFHPDAEFSEFRLMFLKAITFLRPRMTKEKLWAEYEKIVSDYKGSCPCCDNIIYDFANLIEEIIEEGVEPENE